MTVHDVLSRLPEPVTRLLTEHGLDAAAVAPALAWPEDHAVLLAGSFVEAMQTSASDLDFLVLRRSGEPIRRVADQRALDSTDIQSSTVVDRILVMIGGIEFDVCVLTEERMADLAEVIRACVDPDGRIRSLPVLRYLEDKLLCRLREGMVLQNDTEARRWRSLFRIEHLPALLTAGMVSDALSLLEDAVSMPLPRSEGGLENPFGGMLAARAAAERLLRAAVTSVGIIEWDLRYAAVYRNQLRADGAEIPGPLQALEPLLFPPSPASPARTPEATDGTASGNHTVLENYVRLVASELESLIGSLDQRPEMSAVREFLHTFGGDRWRIDRALVDLKVTSS